MAISLSPAERETTILLNEEDDFAIVYTCSRPMMTKLNKLCKSSPKNYKIIEETEVSKTYEVHNKKLISFRTPTKRKPMTDKQKQKAAERLKKAREKKKTDCEN